MARYSTASYSTLRSHLSSLAKYLEAIAELHTQLLHSSPSYLITNPKELISLVEVAKSTLQNNGVSLHTFSSCPEYLSAYKAAYFGLLLQIQTHSHNARLESNDLQARLNRLLFPLSTKLRVDPKSAGKAVAGGYADRLCGVKQEETASSNSSNEMKPAPLSPEAEPARVLAPDRSVPVTRPPNLPPNVMLPPPSPLRTTDPVTSRSTNIQSKAFYSHRKGSSWQLSNRRRISQKTLHFKRRRGEPEDATGEHSDAAFRREKYRNPRGQGPHASSTWHKTNLTDVRIDEAGSGSDDDSGDSDSDSGHVVIPANSPLRQSFGIFCTGRGRGAFNPPANVPRQRPRPFERNSQSSLRRESAEDFMDTSA